MIRRAQDADAEALCRLINRAFAVEKFFLDSDRIDLPQVCENLRKGAFLVAEDGGAMLACVYVEIRGDRGYLGLLSVEPGRQRSGLGKQLVSAAEDFCRDVRCRAMDLNIVDLRVDLPPFYKALGYGESGAAEFPPEIPTKLPCRLIRMSKALACR
jgi:predicted N-acetyltransferase YhbS